jgi:biopolymer transport protein ExbB
MNWTILQVDTIAAGGDQISSTALIDLLIKGGILMIPLAILLVIALYIFFERYMTIKKAAKIDPNFMNNIKDYVSSGNIEAAKTLCNNTDSPIAKMIEKGLMRIGKPLKNIEVAIENTGKLQIYKMEKRLVTLATISGAAPMLGFLGTVIGMIGAFFSLAQAGGEGGAGLLANDIYQALVTTATGLSIGIIAFIGYNTLVSLVEKVVYKMEANSVEFIDLLQEPAS